MNISSMKTNLPVQNMQSRSNNPYSESKTSSVVPTKTKAEIVTISNVGENAKDKWQAIANKYDVTHMSQTEVGAMTEQLYNNKLIKKDVMLHMMAPVSMNQSFEKKYNVLDRMRDSFEFSKNIGGNPEQIEIKRRVFEIIEQLNGLQNNDSQA